MSKVYLHNNAYRSREDALLEWDQPKSDLRPLTFWNIWKIRAVGAAIENGTRILLVASWPGKGGIERRILWDVRAWDVAKWDVADWETATRRLGRWTGYGVRGIQSNPYTLEKRGLEGPLFVMAWRPDPVSWIDFPMPDGVHVARNGWAALDEKVVRGWGIGVDDSPKAPRKGGQGRRLDVAARDAVEQRAMDLAEQWCKGQNWTDIKNTSLREPWDFEATDAFGQGRFIEVKGTTSLGSAFEVTANEVKAAREHGASHLLVSVCNIRLEYQPDGSVRGIDGELFVFDPWKPNDRELKETRYTWKPAASRGFR